MSRAQFVCSDRYESSCPGAKDDEMIFEEDAAIPFDVPALEPARLESMIESLVSSRLAKRIIRAAEMARDCHIEQEEKVVFKSNEAEDSCHQA